MEVDDVKVYLSDLHTDPIFPKQTHFSQTLRYPILAHNLAAIWSTNKIDV